MKRNLLLTPGPTKVPEEVYAALSRPIFHHRTPQFQEHLKEAVEGLKFVFQTVNPVYLLASSGTGAMEASVCSLLSAGDKVLTVEGGKFGERWTEICRAYGINAEAVPVEWGKTVDPAVIKKHLAEDASIKAVFITLCETSTGVTADVEAIGRVVKDTPAVLVVDAVSGLGVTDCKTDAWHLDVVASASHKGLMLPPGLAFLSVSPKAAALMEQSKAPKYYFDLRKYAKAAAKTDTPFTPAINLVTALNESIRIFKRDGLAARFQYFERLAKATREAMAQLGLTLFADPSCISTVLTPVNVPEGIDGGRLVKTLRDVHGISIAGGQGHVKGRIFRIAHMGCVNEEDTLTGIEHIEKVLKESGHDFKPAAGVKAAERYFETHSPAV